ncbi:UNVERIFIED_CONTAM: hypothetical protein GTU68_066898 [Idotea baltica]|nr:hypothetical protein [Idotea baltica]
MPELKTFFKDVKTLIFMPYARPSGISFDAYTKIVSLAFKKIDITVIGIHKFKNTTEAIENAEGIFVGGGNTFVLVNELYERNLVDVLKKSIDLGTPYLGTSAGSNIAGLTMQTTNDMPIVYPPSYETLGCVPFNINAHYLDSDPNSKHKGETRETRIKEFHIYNTIPVIGLREGSWLEVSGDKIVLKGDLRARLFQKGKKTVEIEVEKKLNFQ